jgi:hypothetical protein
VPVLNRDGEDHRPPQVPGALLLFLGAKTPFWLTAWPLKKVTLRLGNRHATAAARESAPLRSVPRTPFSERGEGRRTTRGTDHASGRQNYGADAMAATP